MNRMHEDERDNERRFAEKYAARLDEALSMYRTKSAAADERRKQGEAMRMQGVPDPVIRQILRGQLKLEDWQEGRVKLRSGQVTEANAADPVVPDSLKQTAAAPSMAPQPTDPAQPGQGAPDPRGNDVSMAGRLLFGRRSGDELIAAGRRQTGMQDGMIDKVMSGVTPDPTESFTGDPNATVTAQGDPLEILAKRRLGPENFKDQASFQAAVAALRENPTADISGYIDPNAEAARRNSVRPPSGADDIARRKLAIFDMLYDPKTPETEHPRLRNMLNDLNNLPPAREYEQGILSNRPGTGNADARLREEVAKAAGLQGEELRNYLLELRQRNPALQNDVIDVLEGKRKL